MNWHTISLPLVVVSVVLYHLAQKSIPRESNPLLAVAGAYFFAICVCLAGFFLSGERSKFGELLRNQSWLPVFVLGIAAIGIELGFLYAYRSGWKVSTTATTTNIFVAVSLAFIGLLWYREALTVTNIIGIFLCIAGVVLLNMK